MINNTKEIKIIAKITIAITTIAILLSGTTTLGSDHQVYAQSCDAIPTPTGCTPQNIQADQQSTLQYERTHNQLGAGPGFQHPYGFGSGYGGRHFGGGYGGYDGYSFAGFHRHHFWGGGSGYGYGFYPHYHDYYYGTSHSCTTVIRHYYDTTVIKKDC